MKKRFLSAFFAAATFMAIAYVIPEKANANIDIDPSEVTDNDCIDGMVVVAMYEYNYGDRKLLPDGRKTYRTKEEAVDAIWDYNSQIEPGSTYFTYLDILCDGTQSAPGGF